MYLSLSLLVALFIDAEGTKKGFDKALNAAVAESVLIPVNASGGVAKAENIFKLLSNSYIDAVAVSSILHCNILVVGELKEKLKDNGHKVRA
jgi:imidazole glycerol-phosphate synthase subunit HisF